MITQQTIQNNESGLVVRSKLNTMLLALISGAEGVNNLWRVLNQQHDSLDKLSITEATHYSEVLEGLQEAGRYTDQEVNDLLTLVLAMRGGVSGVIQNPSTFDPSDLDNSVACTLIGLGAGTFTNIKDVSGTPIVVTANNAFTVFYRAANVPYWTYKTLLLQTPPIDDVPTTNSNNLVKSGGVRSYFENLRAQLRGYGVSAQGGVAYNRGIDPVFYCGSFNRTYHGADAEIIMNEELNKLHSPNGLSNETYECNAEDAELRGTRPIPGGICHINLHGSQIWFINNVEGYSEDRWTQVFLNAAASYNEQRVRQGNNIVIRFRIKTDPTLERCDAWSKFYEIPYNIMERFFPSDPQNYDNANRITETGFRGYVNGGIPVESGMTWGSLAVRRASTPDANGLIAIEQTFYARDGNHIGKSWRRLGLIDTQGNVTFFNWYN